MRRRIRSASRLAAAALSSLLLLGPAACGDSAYKGIDRPTFKPVPAGPSWAPAPRRAGALSALAQTQGDRYVLHTAHGDVGFLPGINLGSTTPGFQPGEVHLTKKDLRRWFPLMRRFGFRVLRVYTILPPHFYAELAAYNRAHKDAPLYLLQGVYLPDESYVEKNDLYDPAVTGAFRSELRDAVAAVHGDLEREPRAGRASGEWTADVSAWLAGWIAGAELDPVAVRASDTRNAHAPAVRGRYFRSTPEATPTERWLAARLDELATAEAAYGRTMPIAFVNWPTLDPLDHPQEPRVNEDLVGVDAAHVAATAAWPGGTFASYHAYPNYPDFLRYEPGLQVKRQGRIDPYAGYLSALRRHHAGMPVFITEFGVPSSIGSAHSAPLGRHQGDHSEQEAQAMNADMLRLIHELKLAGGLLFIWSDEWFKTVWNTRPRQIPADRRQLWHDPLTAEQYFGLLATDPLGGADAKAREISESDAVTVREHNDESWVHLEIEPSGRTGGQLTLGFDVVDREGGPARLPGTRIPAGDADFAVIFDFATSGAQAWVRADLDPIMLDDLGGSSLPAAVDGWRRQRLTVGGAQTVPGTGRRVAAEFFEVGKLRRGEMEPDEDGYDSRATWQVDGGTVTLRMPWGLLGMADPSSKRALLPRPDRTATTAKVDRIGLVVHLNGHRIDTSGIMWKPWQAVHYRERIKAGAQTYADAVAAVTPR